MLEKESSNSRDNNQRKRERGRFSGERTHCKGVLQERLGGGEREKGRGTKGSMRGRKEVRRSGGGGGR